MTLTASDDVRLVQALRKTHPTKTTISDLMNVLTLVQDNDLRHVDEAAAAHHAADYIEPLDMCGMFEDIAAEVSYRVSSEQDEYLIAGGHGVPRYHDVTCHTVRIAAARIGDLWLVRGDLALMFGEDTLRRIEAHEQSKTGDAL